MISTGIGRWRGSPIEWKLQWILRVAVSLEFIGHGMFGIIGKESWLAYYDVFGISEDAAWTMMPLTGAVDVTLGLLVLLRPTRALIAYMAFWGLFTATLRPLADQGIWELVERSYNYGVPAALRRRPECPRVVRPRARDAAPHAPARSSILPRLPVDHRPVPDRPRGRRASDAEARPDRDVRLDWTDLAGQ
jgi:uncharacterized membrane protein YphA (DoxX/SURF4 family)